MAHTVRAKLVSKLIARDLEIVIKSSSSGKLGTLLISQGNIEWLPKGNRVNRRVLKWEQFADMMKQEGKPRKKRRRRAKRTAKKRMKR